MGTRGRALSSTRAVFLALLLGLIPVLAQQEELQVGIAGQEVTLRCRVPPQHTGVTWKYHKAVIRMLKPENLKGRAPMTSRSEIDPSSKQLRVWDLGLSDAGIYTCEYGPHQASVSLHVFKLTVSLDGHFLPSEVPELTLMQNSSHPLPNLSITLFNNNNNVLRPKVSQDETHQRYRLELKQLVATDSGTWLCHVHSDSPLINQNISFDVKVLGFQNPDSERKYAAVDSTVTLSWHLNFQEIKWKESFSGQVHLEQQKSATTHELLDFLVPAQGQPHKTKKSSHLRFEIPESKPKSTIEVKLPRVHYNHSGKYQCQLEYNRRYTESQIELVVMKVSASPAGPLPRGAEMTLTCQVSSSLPPNAHLRWERVNGTHVDVKNSKGGEKKLEVNVSSAGLWNCHLIEDKDSKISLNYSVEEAPAWESYVVMGTAIGGGVLVFGLVCLCIISAMRWQRRRQRAKRMAQARQYLLENKTCQCQHRLNK